MCLTTTLAAGGLARATDCALRASLVQALRQGGQSTQRWTQDLALLAQPVDLPADEPQRSQALALWARARS